MATVRYEPVEGPNATPPRYGLIAAAPTIDDGGFWQAGITFSPENCAPGAVGGVDCVSSLPDMSTDDNPNPANVINGGFVVWAADQCSTMAATQRDFEGRARRALAKSESYWVARELWHGDSGTPGRRFTDSSADLVTAAAVTPLEALGRLEWMLGRCNMGGRGMIHVTPQVLDHLVSAQVLTNAGGIWSTPMGNIVVADAGYTGEAANGGDPTTSQWAFATSMIYLRMGQVEALGTTLTDRVDWRINTERFVVWRPVVIEWDECCLLAAQVNVAVPTGFTV